MNNLQTNFDWTPEADAALRRYWSSALSVSQIGVAMGLSKNAVMGRISRLKLPSRRAHEKKFYGLQALNLNAGKRECSFPLGDPQDPDFRFCGQPIAAKSYCAEHFALCYTAPKKRGESNPENKTTMVFSSLQGRMVPKRLAPAQ